MTPNLDNLHAMPAEEVAAKGIAVLPPTLLHAAEELSGNEVLGSWAGRDC